VAGFDMHSHTLLSDGTTTPEQNVADAVALGLEGLAVTDHDTTAPFDRAIAAAEGTGLEIVPGVEFSAEHEGVSVHVLGFWVSPDDADLQTEMDRLRNERERRAEQIVELFNALEEPVPVTMARVRELAGEAPIGRPHIAKAVVETGMVPDERAVFDRYLADDGPCYVPKYAVSPVRAVELLRGAGGVAVVAHPGLYGNRRADDPGLPDDVVEAMAAAGMAGIEAAHPDHTPAHRDRYTDLARALGLVVTAGSDYHGAAKENRLGSATTERDVVEALRGRLG
jgi:3',5'-nucleoside bisphosphate phosphatase